MPETTQACACRSNPKVVDELIDRLMSAKPTERVLALRTVLQQISDNEVDVISRTDEPPWRRRKSVDERRAKQFYGYP